MGQLGETLDHGILVCTRHHVASSKVTARLAMEGRPCFVQQEASVWPIFPQCKQMVRGLLLVPRPPRPLPLVDEAPRPPRVVATSTRVCPLSDMGCLTTTLLMRL
jgi:hypothetical protein